MVSRIFISPRSASFFSVLAVEFSSKISCFWFFCPFLMTRKEFVCPPLIALTQVCPPPQISFWWQIFLGLIVYSPLSFSSEFCPLLKFSHQILLPFRLRELIAAYHFSLVSILTYPTLHWSLGNVRVPCFFFLHGVFLCNRFFVPGGVSVGRGLSFPAVLGGGSLLFFFVCLAYSSSPLP